MKEKKFKLLRWFIDFINLDMENLDYGERLKWVAQTLTVIDYGRYDIPQRPFPANMMPPDRYKDRPPLEQRFQEWSRGEQINKYQRVLRKFLSNIFDKIVSSSARAENWESARALGNFVDFCEQKKRVRIRLETPLMKDLEFQLGNNGEDLSYRIDKDKFMDTPFLLSIIASNDPDTLIIWFCRALEGAPLRVIKRCPECKKWFLHTSRREKRFCSNRCAARKTGRDKRHTLMKNDPEAWAKAKKDGAKRARKSYEGKVKEKLPGAVADRRPYKHKDDL